MADKLTELIKKIGSSPHGLLPELHHPECNDPVDKKSPFSIFDYP